MANEFRVVKKEDIYRSGSTATKYYLEEKVIYNFLFFKLERWRTVTDNDPDYRFGRGFEIEFNTLKQAQDYAEALTAEPVIMNL